MYESIIHSAESSCKNVIGKYGLDAIKKPRILLRGYHVRQLPPKQVIPLS